MPLKTGTRFRTSTHPQISHRPLMDPSLGANPFPDWGRPLHGFITSKLTPVHEIFQDAAGKTGFPGAGCGRVRLPVIFERSPRNDRGRPWEGEALSRDTKFRAKSRHKV